MMRMMFPRLCCAVFLCCVSSTHAFAPRQTGSQKPSPGFLLSTPRSTDVSRSDFFASILATAVVTTIPSTSHAFRGGTGAGGLGKTKPETGVVFVSEESVPAQQRNGDVVAELLVGQDDGSSSGTPVLVSYNSPWPLLETTSGMETRNLQEPESAFVQVVSDAGTAPLNEQFFVDSIFASSGKYGAYGVPSDISVKPVIPEQLYVAKFTSLTPAMRESERQAYIATRRVGKSVVMLVAGSTGPRFLKKEPLLRKVTDSFRVTESPKTGLRQGKA